MHTQWLGYFCAFLILLIVGLGNPEPEYRYTRHNMGAECLNKFAFDYNITLTAYKFKSLFGTGFLCDKKIILLKPLTYMNKSGEAVAAALKYYKISDLVNDLIIVVDDLATELGNIRLKPGGGAGGHNGLTDIINKLETQNFARLRIGIGAKPPYIKQNDYVLSGFLKSENAAFIEGLTKATDALFLVLKDGLDKAMNSVNLKIKPE